VEYDQYDDPTEAITAGHYESLAAIMAAANAQRNIACREEIRDVFSKDDGTVEAAREAANKVQIKNPRAKGEGTGRKSTGEVKDAKDTAFALFEACRADEGLLRRMVKNGVVKQDAYDRWLTREQAKAEKAAAPATA
jgi:hypothetical protein